MDTRFWAWIFGPVFALGLACGDEAGGNDADNPDGCTGAKCDDPVPEEFACQRVNDLTGERPASFVEGLSDPVARLLLKRGDTCPETLDDIMAKLREQDTVGCEAGGRAGLATRVVSETAQLEGEPSGVRLVTTRTCDSRPEFGLIISLFGIHASTTQELPQNATEIIGFDPEAQVFNYFALEGGQWNFHGSSIDFIQDKGGRCKNCHTGGGLIMKELDAPWLHWEGDTTTPGAQELVDRFDDLGTKTTGVNLESLVETGNAKWNATRVSVLSDPERTDIHAGSLEPLLRPLFCATEFNVQSTGAPTFFGGGPPSPANGLRSDFLLDPTWSAFAQITWDPMEYHAQTAQSGQRIGVPGESDTFFEFTYVERAQADINYVQQLEAAGIVDQQFIKDVLVTDFTRPLFSDARCALLDFVPSFDELEPTSGDDAGPDPTDGGFVDGRTCCTAETPPTPGCGVLLVELCVCAIDEFCCETQWDGQCANEVASFGCGICEAAPPPPPPPSPPSDGSTHAAAPLGRAFADAPRPHRAPPTVGQLRQAMIKNLAAAEAPRGSPESLLLINLKAAGQNHDGVVQDFVNACKDRADNGVPGDFIADILEVAAVRRARAEAFNSAIEEPGLMLVEDDLTPSPNTHLDAQTCVLVP